MGRKKKQKQEEEEILYNQESAVKRGIFAVSIFAVAVISLLSVFDLAGGFGRFFYRVLELVFGWGFWIFPIVLLAAGYMLLANSKYQFRTINWIGVFLVIIGYSGFFHLTQDPDTFKEILSEGIGGGYIGYAMAWPLFQIMGRWAAMVVTIALFLIGTMLMFNTSLESLMNKLTFKEFRDFIKEKFSREGSNYDEDEDEEEEEEDGDVEFEAQEVGGEDEEEVNEETESVLASEVEEAPKKKRKKFPKIDIPIELLNDKVSKPTSGDIKACQSIIKKTLENFGIQVEMANVAIGPTVTQYTFRPAEGVKLSRIIGLGNDLALALAAHPIRIEAPIPGKSLVGIEVPNKKIATVPLRQILESEEFKHRESSLEVVLGKDVAGKPWLTDLSKLPHLLVAGATNSGKTVCLNAIIISLLYQNQPDDLKFILVDPKRVEMTGYNNIPHLLTPVITDVKKTVNALKWTVSEMERRFHVLSNAGKRNIASYNATHKNEKLPYLVFVIDELADLMSTSAAEVEGLVIRLAQMARAVGIHLILATQRPSVDVITGLIKANVPGRIAFSVASLTDSRTILDVSGAEKLLGRGDMLYSSAEISKPKRIQGAFCSDDDIENVVAYLKDKADPDYEEGVTEKVANMGGGGIIMNSDDDGGDELLEEAKDLILQEGKASASYLQRRLRVGYARAARLLDLLEDRGIVGPADGSKPREILIKKGEEMPNTELQPSFTGQANIPSEFEKQEDEEEEIDEEEDEEIEDLETEDNNVGEEDEEPDEEGEEEIIEEDQDEVEEEEEELDEDEEPEESDEIDESEEPDDTEDFEGEEEDKYNF